MVAIPNIPIAPGIPPLLRVGGVVPRDDIPFLTENQVQDQRTGREWGVFRNGQQVVTPDTFVSIDFRQGWALADYPVENGAFESYNKVDMPFDARVRFASGGSEQNRQALLQQVVAIAEDLNFYDVVTPEIIYHNCNVQHYDYRRTATNGVGLIVVELWLLEIRTVPKRGAQVTFPSSAAPFHTGQIAPQTPTQRESAIIAPVQ
jgi:hypothetical protein